MVDFDWVLSGGKIVDGTGNPWFWGDVAVHEGKIAAITKAGRLQGKQNIHVDGRFIAPGFVDVHTHSDLSLLIDRKAESAVRQGVTTHVLGNCGMSPAPIGVGRIEELKHMWGSISSGPGISWGWRTFGEYLDEVENGGVAINATSLVGHGALRIAVLGFENRLPTDSELEQMQALLDEAMLAGAHGISTGLVYPPGCFADTEEIVALSKNAAAHGGIYASHIRGERETILDAVREAIYIGETAGIPVQISHNAPKYGAPCDARENLRLVDEARRRGLDVTVDNDVHTDLGPLLVEALPQPIQEKGIEEITSLLRNPEARNQVREEIVLDRLPAFGPVGLLKHGQWERIVMLSAIATPEVVGKTIATLAQERGIDPFDVYFDLILQNGENAEAIFDYIDEENIRILLKHPATMICSDGQAMAMEGYLNDPPSYNPCSFGEFPGVLERYVRDEAVLTLAEAIRKMASFPARRLGLRDRGILQPGAWADIVVFDLARIHDRATNLYPHTYPFKDFPHQYPEGIDYVFVNGVLVVDGDQHTGVLPGKVLRRV